MNSDGLIKRGDIEALKLAGYHTPLEEHEASKLSVMNQSERFAELAKMRHEELEHKRVRAEKYPGQSTAYLKGASQP